MYQAAVAVHDIIKPLSWLLGKWVGSGSGKYSTIKDFQYTEEIEFTHTGQPFLQYSAYSYAADTNKPLHREVGFVRVKPGTNQVAMVLAHNNGVSDLEEGHFNDSELTCGTLALSNTTFGEEPLTKKLKRTFKLDGDELSQVLWMETDQTKMEEHLRASYKKVQ